MKHLLLLLTLVTGTNGFAQKIRLTDTANRWVFEHQVGITGEAVYDTYTYKIGADTTIGSKVYKRVAILSDKVRWDGPYSQGGTGKIYIGSFFREDTIANRVYCITVGDTVERLVFDAAWQVGDSVAWGVGIQKGFSRVLTRDSAFFNNAWHRVFSMRSALSNFSVIEGVGTEHGTAYSAYPLTGENTPSLRCFTHAGSRPSIILPGNRYDNVKSCAATLEVREQEEALAAISVAPNPGGADMYLNIPGAIGKGTLTITDGLGRAILNARFEAPRRMSIGQYLSVPGLYSYRIEYGAGKHYTARFLFQ